MQVCAERSAAICASRSARRMISVAMVFVMAGCAEAPRPRNAILIVLDTLRADRVSAYGHERRTTPVLDRLAEESCDAECQGQTRIELAGLDGVDRLAGDVELLGQSGLRPVALGPQHLETVLQA